VGAIPIVIVLLLAKPLAVSFWVILGFILLHVLESKFLMPAVLGASSNFTPVLIIVSLLVGAQVGGLLGMFSPPRCSPSSAPSSKTGGWRPSRERPRRRSCRGKGRGRPSLAQVLDLPRRRRRRVVI